VGHLECAALDGAALTVLCARCNIAEPDGSCARDEAIAWLAIRIKQRPISEAVE
jgi:hypothetical protein